MKDLPENSSLTAESEPSILTPPETGSKSSPSPPANSVATIKVVSAAYLAGLVDGEGHFAIERYRDPHGNQYYYPRLKVTNTNRYVLDCLKHTFGGNVSTTGRKRAGQKQGFRWSLGGEDAYDVLRRIYPYLIIKRPVARLFGKFIRYRRRPSATWIRMYKYQRKLRALNHRGD